MGLKRWFRNFWQDTLRPLFRATTTAVVETYLPMAINAVVAVAADKTLLTDDAKRSAFAKTLANEAASKGYAIATGSALNLLRELALEAAKAAGRV